MVLDYIDIDGHATGIAPALDKRYFQGAGVDQLLAQENLTEATGSANRVWWVLPDHLGSTTELVDTLGKVVAHYQYDSFCVLLDGRENVTRYQFTGREHDSNTDLNYHRARWYDPLTGKWMSEDPIGFAAGDANVTRYVGNGVLNGVDPSGRIPLDFIWDAANIVYDFAIGDHVGLAADSAAFAVPYVPAGTTKVRKLLGWSDEAVQVVKSAWATKIVALSGFERVRRLRITLEYVGQVKNAAGNVYNKHFLPKSKLGRGWWKSTKGGDAKWIPGWTDSKVKSLIDSAVEEATKRKNITNANDLDGYIYDALGPVGGSNGESVCRIQLQVNSSGQIHAFPVK